MKKNILKKMLSFAIASCMIFSLSTVASATEAIANDASANTIFISFDKEEAYDYYRQHVQNNDIASNMTISSNMRGINPPTQLHRLDISNYSYSGGVSVTAGQTLYTSKYFNANTSGQLWIEGYANISTSTNQYMNIYIIDKTAGTTQYVTLSSNNIIHDDSGNFRLFYYNFAFVNLSTTHDYYIGFNTTAVPSFYDVNGIISHSYTNQISPD